MADNGGQKPTLTPGRTTANPPPPPPSPKCTCTVTPPAAPAAPEEPQ